MSPLASTTAVGLDRFNTVPACELAPVLTACANIPSWVAAVIAGRPYPDVATLVARADHLAAVWTPAEVLAALADHPRIGERRTVDDAQAELSEREQAGVRTDVETAARLRVGNAAYERRFGRVFLIRAAGRSAHEILDVLQRRLGNDPATELTETTGQLREIALLRLAATVRGTGG